MFSYDVYYPDYSDNDDYYLRCSHGINDLEYMCSKNLEKFCKFNELIDFYVYESGMYIFEEMSDLIKMELSGALLDALDDPTEWFINSKDLDSLMINLSSALLSNKNEDFIQIKELMIKMAIDEFSEKIQEYLFYKKDLLTK